ncbi:MAG: S8 family serine peptidase [Micromonosporaceae bacterium]
MVPGRRAGLLLLAAALAIGIPPSGAVYAESSAQPDQAPSGDSSYRSVTLVTGDRVDVYQRGDRETPRVRKGAGRGHVTFAVTRIEGHLYVIPRDAVGLIQRGQLDRRLFDVTALLKLGYDDRHRKDVPLLVQGATAEGVAPLADDGGASVTRKLSSVDAVAVRQPKRTAGKFWSAVTTGSRDLRAGVKRIWLDGKRKALLDRSVPQVGAPSAWQAGYTGKGVKVAVLDTGIDATHADFTGRIGASKDFSGSGTVNDTVGHGTHVASTIAGTGAASGGKYQGVAPDATLLIGKVCADAWCEESAILAGMQWAADSGAKVVNVSLGGGDTPQLDPLEQAVNDLTASHGLLFVIAAGNAGNAGGDETLSSPASADAALAVGAVTKDDQLADFSSRGPRTGDGALKPEITAPGVEIVAANAKDGFLGEPGQKYTTLSGTSMATPHVAGAAALLAQQHTDWKAGTLKSALVGSAKTLPELGAHAQGAGRLDVGRAVTHSGYATPAVVSAPLASWPHDDDQPVTKTVTYHNPSSAPVTYELAMTARGPDGQPAAAGIFTASAERVTVPAGGTATVDVTVDTRVQSPDGYYSAWLTATAGDARVTTPVAVNKEVESYQLTVDLKDRTGKPATDYWLIVFGLDSNRSFDASEGGGTERLRLPKGRYHVMAFVNTGEREASLLTYPKYDVGGDSSVAVDASQAKPVSVTLDRPEAKPFSAIVGYTHFYNDGRGAIGATLLGDAFDGFSTRHLGPELGKDELLSDISANFAVPGAGGDLARSTRVYNLAYYEYGHLVTGYAKHESEANLAAVRSTYHSQRSGQVGVKVWFPQPPGMDVGGWVTGYDMPLPITRTEYHNTTGVEWSNGLWLVDEFDIEGSQLGAVGKHKPGRVYSEKWNTAAFGPSAAGALVTRTGDDMFVGIPVYSDGAGHAGFSLTDTAKTRLYKDGKQVAESSEAGYGEFGVPAGEGAYALKVDATRSVSDFSTRLSCTWTFRSGTTGTETRLPLITVGFSPKVDTYNRAKAGQKQLVPVTVVGQPGTGKVKLKSLTVEVSFDDGKTWKKVRVTRWHPGDGWLAHIVHPNGKKYVSLRTSVADKKGNTVKETIIRAYALK